MTKAVLLAVIAAFLGTACGTTPTQKGTNGADDEAVQRREVPHFHGRHGI